MKSKSCVFLYSCLLLNLWFFFPFAAIAQTKAIHLRNETILTPEATRANAQSVTAVSGLYLIQFEGRPQPQWRAQLKAMGVDLLHYVPDDAFIAKFDHATIRQVQTLSFVRYVGPFRPEHKVHPALQAEARAKMATNGILTVNLLVSPLASDQELAEVRAQFSAIQHESHLRQGTVLRGSVAAQKLSALAVTSGALWMERSGPRKLVDEVASKLIGGDDGHLGTPTVTQQLGFGGSNVTVAVADTGLNNGDAATMHPDLAGRVSKFIFYPPLTSAADEHSHGTHVAGIIAGNAATGEKDDSGALYGLGVASQANLVVERIFDADGDEVDPAPSDEQLTRDAVRAGAKIGSNSWGNDVQGAYDIDAAAFDELVRDADSATPGDQPYILEFSAGNAGPDSLTMDSPASAKNVIATGASENGGEEDFGLYDDGPDTIADFSSRGPTEDGRIKPDVVAPGTFVASLLSASASSQFAWLPIDNYYIYMGGTSQAGPHVSGAAAVFVQYYQSIYSNATPSPALVKAALINSATELDVANGGPGNIPNFDEGWGRVALTNLIGTRRGIQYLDQTVLLTTGQIFEQHTFVQDSSEPLKITLAYTDVAGFPGAMPALVNDLDLEVVGPDGTVYRGNQFSGGESIPNAASADRLNNVEAVHLNQPLPGDYLIRVRAYNVPLDARLDTQTIDQDFALVISGALLPLHTGAIILDRASYTAPGTINVEVFDAARAGNHAVSVAISSTTEAAGENYTLQAAGNYGAFTGAVATVMGPAVVDGKLEVQNGDTIRASYIDSSGTNRITTATVDLVAPTLTGVSESLDLGVVTITWQTSEPANSVVRYSTDFSFNLGVTNNTLTTSHSVKLSNLIPGQTYHFIVSSTDAAGNVMTNNNAGADYTFVGVTEPSVLLVDAYDVDDDPDDDAVVIPLTTYTDALDGTGFNYAVWSVSTRGYPQLADLQPFQAVMWRVVDDEVNYEGTNNTISPAEQTIIQNYLNGGGSFFTAAMGLLTGLGNVPFRQNVLQVGGFVANDDPPAPCSDCDEFFGVPAIYGTTADPISSDVSLQLNYSQYPSFDLGFGDGDDDTVYGPDFSDTFTPTTNATPIFFESVSGKPCGMRYPQTGKDGVGRVVFFGFPLDTIPESGTAPNNETAILRNVLNFLIPGAGGVGTVTMDAGAYTLPDQVTVEVADTDLAGTGQTQVTFSTTSYTNRLTVNLNETTHKGLFRGVITLASTNVVGSTNQLRSANGDTVTASYFDVSNNRTVTASAVVDTSPPIISAVGSIPGYNDATISWTTSKPADSTVQAGASAILDHSGSSAAIGVNHAVTLSGLTANTLYHFEVTSRDSAGNSTTDDNGGNYYTFRTLAAPRPPWSDDLETGAPGWTVIPDPDFPGPIQWTLGTPNNGLQTSAHSGKNAWGSNLKGQNVDIASSYLASPVIDLSGMSQATLMFWDSFDFSSGLEEGQVLIATNGLSGDLSTLPLLEDFSGGSSPDWEQEEIDLTPYVGKTVQIVWDYVGVGIGDPVNGWLVDDVAIIGTNAGSASLGTITIIKNLGQGSFSLTGPLNQTGNATLTTISNAPAGSYTLQFDDISFYQTPAPQTQTLAASGTLTFAGNYTFTDANSNGISDAWEQYFFGSVATNRTQTTDTDHDGMSDYAEFIAGTDPTNPSSKLVFLPTTIQPSGKVTLQWAAIPGRTYQVQSSTNLTTWTAVTDWLSASGSPMSYATTNSLTGSQMYRIAVRP